METNLFIESSSLLVPEDNRISNEFICSDIILIRNRNVYSRFFYLQTYIREYLRTGKWKPYITDECRDGRIYFTVPVFLGLLLCYALRFQIL